MRDKWKTSEGQVGDKWETSERQVRDKWETSGRQGSKVPRFQGSRNPAASDWQGRKNRDTTPPLLEIETQQLSAVGNENESLNAPSRHEATDPNKLAEQAENSGSLALPFVKSRGKKTEK